MMEFNLILKTAKAAVGAAGFWKLLIGILLMFISGYICETAPGFGWIGFILGLVVWTVVAGVDYMRMHKYWVQLDNSPALSEKR